MNVTIQSLEMKACCLSTDHTKVDRLGECGDDLPCVSSAPLHSRTQTDSVPPHQNQFPSAGSELLSVRRNLQIARKYAPTFLFIIKLLRGRQWCTDSSSVLSWMTLYLQQEMRKEKKIDENRGRCNLIYTLTDYKWFVIDVYFSWREWLPRGSKEMMLTSESARSWSSASPPHFLSLHENVLNFPVLVSYHHTPHSTHWLYNHKTSQQQLETDTTRPTTPYVALLEGFKNNFDVICCW